jgi:hypothetical protein
MKNPETTSSKKVKGVWRGVGFLWGINHLVLVFCPLDTVINFPKSDESKVGTPGRNGMELSVTSVSSFI